MRAAYRRKGWALSNVDHIEQCAHDLYTEAIKEQAGEGCHMWGMLEVGAWRVCFFWGGKGEERGGEGRGGEGSLGGPAGAGRRPGRCVAGGAWPGGAGGGEGRGKVG